MTASVLLAENVCSIAVREVDHRAKQAKKDNLVIPMAVVKLA
jgi:hypothetical protein